MLREIDGRGHRHVHFHGAGVRQGTRRLRRCGRTAEEVGDVAEGVEGAEVLGLHLRRVRQLLLQRRQDLHALDRVDAQVRVQAHAQVQHLRGVARLLRHHRQQRRVQTERSDSRGRNERRNGCGDHRRRGQNDGLRRDRQRSDHDRHRRQSSRRGRIGEEERLLLRHETGERPLRGLLRIEKLLVEARRLLLHLLQGGERLLRGGQRLREGVVGVSAGVGVGHGASLGGYGTRHGRARGAGRPGLNVVRAAQGHGHARLRRQRARAAPAPGFPRGQPHARSRGGQAREGIG